MAWNEPGGGKNNQDPWRGNGNKNDGPPDLDEVVKKLQEKLNGFFGGKGGGRPGGSSGLSLPVIGVIVVIVVAVWLAMGFYRVEQAERSVVLRFGEYDRTETAGLRWYMPGFEEVMKVNTGAVNNHRHRASMLTEDQNIVDVELDVQYRVNDAKQFFLEVSNPANALTYSTESALRHVVGGMKMDLVITEGRQTMGIEVAERLQEYLDRYETGLFVTKVNVEDAHPPSQVKEAFDDVIRAREDEERVQDLAEAYANKVIPEARGRAARILEEANAYKQEVVSQSEGQAERFNKLYAEYAKAPEVTRQRLYLETMQKVLSNTSKVIMDVSSGNSLMYLPLDQIVGQSSSKGGDEGGDLTFTPPVADDRARSAAPTRSPDIPGLRTRSGWEGR